MRSIHVLEICLVSLLACQTIHGADENKEAAKEPAPLTIWIAIDNKAFVCVVDGVNVDLKELRTCIETITKDDVREPNGESKRRVRLIVSKDVPARELDQVLAAISSAKLGNVQRKASIFGNAAPKFIEEDAKSSKEIVRVRVLAGADVEKIEVGGKQFSFDEVYKNPAMAFPNPAVEVRVSYESTSLWWHIIGMFVICEKRGIDECRVIKLRDPKQEK